MNKEPPASRSPDGAELWEALARYMAGESTPEENARIRDWLAADPARAELLATLDSSFQPLTAAAAPDLDVEAALQRVKARFDEPKVYELPISKSIPKEQSSRRWSRTLVRVAAAVLVVLGVSVVWRASQNREIPLVATGVYTTTVGKTDSLRLPDGTRVILAPLSRLVLQEGFDSTARVVELNGEALFDVYHDTDRPFSVRAGGATIRDIGTAFSVRSQDSRGVRVAVTAGSVVMHASQAPESEGLVLNAGDRAVLAADGELIAERNAVTDDDTAFTRGRLVFDDASFEQVAAELKRWYGIDLVAADATLGNRHLTAAFERESADQVLSVVGLAFGAQLERKGDTVFVKLSQ